MSFKLVFDHKYFCLGEFNVAKHFFGEASWRAEWCFFFTRTFFWGERNSRDFLVAVFLHSAMYLGGVLKCWTKIQQNHVRYHTYLHPKMTKKNKAWTLNFHFGTGQIIVTENTPEMVGFSCWEMTGIRAIVGKSDGLGERWLKNLVRYLDNLGYIRGVIGLGWSQKIGGVLQIDHRVVIQQRGCIQPPKTVEKQPGSWRPRRLVQTVKGRGREET